MKITAVDEQEIVESFVHKLLTPNEIAVYQNFQAGKRCATIEQALLDDIEWGVYMASATARFFIKMVSSSKPHLAAEILQDFNRSADARSVQIG